MARLDDLIARVGDAALRRELEVALAELKRRQRFGLVFEEHVPETTALYGLPVQVGSLVQRRDDPAAKHLYRVTALAARGGAATVAPHDGGQAESVPLRDLLVVKRFGEPIYPALTPLGAVRRGGDRPHHAVINGENFHALQLLAYLFEGRVDCIYIDPPYNTGARDWKYNNRFVDAADQWRHSKWLSMMEKRLRLARRLLRPDGVLIATIDEHEATSSPGEFSCQEDRRNGSPRLQLRWTPTFGACAFTQWRTKRPKARHLRTSRPLPSSCPRTRRFI
jgi:adenine-specific DNA-methyltransferase